MTPLLKTGRCRFDRSALRDYTTSLAGGTSFRYGGVRHPVEGPAVPGDAVGFAHHVGSVWAMRLIGPDDRPPPGSQGPDVWEPPLGWDAPRGLIRFPRVLFCGGGTDVCGAVAAALNPAGVTVVSTFGTTGGLWSFALPVPVASAVERDDGPEPRTGFEFLRPSLTFLDAGLLVGGDIMLADVNRVAPWQYGGIGGGPAPADVQTYTVFLAGGGSPPSPPSGQSFATASPNSKVVAFVADALAHVAAAGRLAARCRSYHHLVLHPQGEQAGVDSAAIFAAMTGGSPLFERRRYNPTNPFEPAATIVAAATAFFGT